MLYSLLIVAKRIAISELSCNFEILFESFINRYMLKNLYVTIRIFFRNVIKKHNFPNSFFKTQNKNKFTVTDATTNRAPEKNNF